MTTTLDQFEELRPDLARLAYRMLGSRSDADDILQEAYLRWSRADRTDVQAPRPFLMKVVTRLSIDRRREIDARKETYIGPWLPEPILPSSLSSDQPLEVGEQISLAFLYLLERLNPVERAAYLLRQVFNYDYAEIADLIEKSEPNSRQLVSRAEHKLFEGSPRFEPSVEEVDRLTREFLQACTTGDLSGLLQLFSEDVLLVSDGGGKVTAALRPVEGADKVARFFLGIFRKAPEYAHARILKVNGYPALAGYLGDQLVTLFSFDIADNRITRCFAHRNPDKLRS